MEGQLAVAFGMSSTLVFAMVALLLGLTFALLPRLFLLATLLIGARVGALLGFVGGVRRSCS